jgi:DNA topoisomerase-1
MNRVVSKDELAAAAAKSKLASRLVYISDLATGITRKPGKRGFLYATPHGKRITDPAEIARLNSLAVPPAYTDVIISTDPHTHIQAIGVDARGRRQYRYHADWRSERGRAKFDRLVDFAAHLPGIRERVDLNLRERGMTMDKALATIVWMLDNLYIRVGNAAYAQENQSYGLTTLRNRHVKVEGSIVKFRFKGKSGKQWNLAHSDRRIANVVRKLQELPGQNLFQYVCDDIGCRQISSQDVNDYIRDTSGHNFSSRQFRTWGATCMAVAALAPLEVAGSQRAIARQINDAVDLVAAKLVNTRAVCRSSYIHPAVLRDFEAGNLADVLRFKTRSERLLQWMDQDEIRVFLWLKRQRSLEGLKANLR